MLKKLGFIIYKLINFIDRLIFFLFKKKLIVWVNDLIHLNSYRTIEISKEKINFFVPNSLINWRIETFYEKEPETLKWIDNFSTDKNNNLIFWDIGSNIGLYSIYCKIKHKNSKIIAFEPSTSNLRVLSRNIFINNFQSKISIYPLPLTDKKNEFLSMNEQSFIEGGALNSFGVEYNYEGKNFMPNMSYLLPGTSIDNLIENNILQVPDYIKIDVDGTEHIILNGASLILKNHKLKSILIEINENFDLQFQEILRIMRENNFEISEKQNNTDLHNFDSSSKFSKTYNYIFKREIN